MRGRAASFKARHAVSMSSRLQRARPAMIGPRTSRATRFTDSQSPREAIGKPASMMSTPSSASAFATRSFSGCVMLQPGDCSPSRSVVSKMRTRLGSVIVLSRPIRQRRDTGEVRRVVHVAGAAVLRQLRIRAQRPGERLRRIVGGTSGADHALWRDAPLNPSLQGGEDVALRIPPCRRSAAAVAKAVRARAATTVRHPGHEKQAVEILDRRSARSARIRVFREKAAHGLVVLDRTRCGNGGVSPAVVLNEFPARGSERPQVGAGRVEDGAGLRVGDGHVAVEVEHPKIPLRVLEYRRAVIAVAESELDRSRGVRRRDPGGPPARYRFGPERLSDEDAFVGPGIDRPLVDLLERIDLRLGQAVGRVRTLAEKRGRIELAGARILNQTVSDAVQAIACGHDSALDNRELGGRDRAVRRGEHCALVPNERREQVRPVVRGGAREDADEVFRKALRLHQRFAAAVGASVEVAPLRVAAVKRADDRFRLQRGFMYGAIAEVDQFLRVPNRPIRTAATFVAVVGSSDGVTAAHWISKRAGVNRACPAAVALLAIFGIPRGRRRQPQGKLDFRILGWAYHAANVAMSGYHTRTCRRTWNRRRRGGAFRHARRRGDARVRQLAVHEALARLLRIRSMTGRQDYCRY